MTTTTDRSMATAPYPMRCTKRPVRVEAGWSGGSYNSRTVGHLGIVHLSDGSEAACCDRPHGHKKTATLMACVTAKVADLNAAAGVK